MANYMAQTRTNYFHVTSKEAFDEFAEHLVATEDEVKIFEGSDSEGNPTYGFYAYSPISYRADLEDEDWYDDISDDDFIEAAQKIIAKDDALILTEIGHEKMRYLVGYALVVTQNGHRWINLSNASVQAARELLNNNEFTTELDY